MKARHGQGSQKRGIVPVVIIRLLFMRVYDGGILRIIHPGNSQAVLWCDTLHMHRKPLPLNHFQLRGKPGMYEIMEM